MFFKLELPPVGQSRLDLEPPGHVKHLLPADQVISCISVLGDEFIFLESSIRPHIDLSMIMIFFSPSVCD